MMAGRTPTAVQTRRVLAYMAGASIAEIARTEGVRYESVRESLHSFIHKLDPSGFADVVYHRRSLRDVIALAMAVAE